MTQLKFNERTSMKNNRILEAMCKDDSGFEHLLIINAIYSVMEDENNSYLVQLYPDGKIISVPRGNFDLNFSVTEITLETETLNKLTKIAIEEGVSLEHLVIRELNTKFY